MIRLTDLRLSRAELTTRMPFRYGIATMSETPHVLLEVHLVVDRNAQRGVAADHLPPKWFTKKASGDIASEIDEMLRVIRHAMKFAAEIRANSVFAFWRELYCQQSAWATAEKIPPLLAHFGTSLVERALIDAFARATGKPFHRLVQSGALGLELSSIHGSLAGSSTRDWLPAEPRRRVFARHTVGLLDPLLDSDIPASERLHDGLPQSLEASIRVYGLRHFKIKVNGPAATNLARLEAIAEVLERAAPAGYRQSIDGNESFTTVAEFRSFFAEANARPKLQTFFRNLLFVEQPFHRDVALAATTSLVDWPERPPIIIDESDAELDSLPRALALGYAGTSHKNCKGVFKGLATGCRIAQLNRSGTGAHFIQSGEDLSNIGPVALLQDLAVQAVLGVESVERNGHHYFAGLSFWSDEIQAAVLAHHSDLYTRSDHSWPRINIQEGELALDSINAAPFGTAFDARFGVPV